MQEIPTAAGAPSEEHLLVSENHLLVLASEENEELSSSIKLEIEVLERALKDCIKNMKAWEANERRNYGKSETNKAGAERYRLKALEIEQRIKELQGQTTA